MERRTMCLDTNSKTSFPIFCLMPCKLFPWLRLLDKRRKLQEMEIEEEQRQQKMQKGNGSAASTFRGSKEISQMMLAAGLKTYVSVGHVVHLLHLLHSSHVYVCSHKAPVRSMTQRQQQEC